MKSPASTQYTAGSKEISLLWEIPPLGITAIPPGVAGEYVFVELLQVAFDAVAQLGGVASLIPGGYTNEQTHYFE
jgi:hypothetical protein